MQLSLLRKLRRLIRPKQSPPSQKQSAEISEQGRVSDMDEAVQAAEIIEAEGTQPSVAEQTVDEDIRALREGFPELSGLESITQLKNPTRYAALRDLGLSAEEAYLATSPRHRQPDNRAHLTSGVPAAATPPASAMTKSQMAEARELFKGMSDAQIQKLYQKVTK